MCRSPVDLARSAPPFDTGDDHTIDPAAGPVTEIELPDFKEGAHVHERDGWFFLSYGYRYPQRVARTAASSGSG